MGFLHLVPEGCLAKGMSSSQPQPQNPSSPLPYTAEDTKMHPQRGGVARPGRGADVDLEALQDAFMRSAEKPSARVTRSKVGEDAKSFFQKSRRRCCFAVKSERVKSFASRLSEMMQGVVLVLHFISSLLRGMRAGLFCHAVQTGGKVEPDCRNGGTVSFFHPAPLTLKDRRMSRPRSRCSPRAFPKQSNICYPIYFAFFPFRLEAVSQAKHHNCVLFPQSYGFIFR